MLPGLCVLVQRWVSEVALSSFYSGGAKSFTLDAWFENSSVVYFIETMDSKNGFKAAVGNVINVITSPVVAFFTKAGESQKVEDSDDDSETVEEFNQTEDKNGEYIYQFEGGNESPAEVVQTPVQTQFEEVAGEVEIEEESSSPDVSRSSNVSIPSPIRETTVDANQNEYLRGMNAENMKIFDEDDLPRAVDASSITPLSGEDSWMRQAYEARQLRWGRVTLTSLLLLASMTLTLRRYGGNNALSKIPLIGSSFKKEALLSKGQVYALIQKWQRVKSDALGKAHRVEGLETILGGPLVKEWNVRAEDLKSKGWHYVHDQHKCKINSVKRGPTQNVVEVVAEIKETVIAHKGEGSAPQTFPTSYRVTYEITEDAGSWKFTKAVISK